MTLSFPPWIFQGIPFPVTLYCPPGIATFLYTSFPALCISRYPFSCDTLLSAKIILVLLSYLEGKHSDFIVHWIFCELVPYKVTYQLQSCRTLCPSIRKMRIRKMCLPFLESTWPALVSPLVSLLKWDIKVYSRRLFSLNCPEVRYRDILVECNRLYLDCL